MFDSFVQFLLNITHGLGYFGVFILMTIESTFIPYPSELIIPPAAYLAAQGKMNIYLIIFFGTLGSVCGALINYCLGLYLGRPLIYSLVEHRHAKFLFLNRRKLEKAEKYFVKYGDIATFIGRLIPGVRHLISLPAGFARMPIKPFLFYTALGAGIWVTFLSISGYLLGR